jgi:hypothetical protein
MAPRYEDDPERGNLLGIAADVTGRTSPLVEAVVRLAE